MTLDIIVDLIVAKPTFKQLYLSQTAKYINK